MAPPTGRPFQKGQSGNPGGRPKSKDIAATVRRKTKNGRELIEKALAIKDDPKASAGEQLRATEILLDRGWGRAKQIIEAEVTANAGNQAEPMNLEMLTTAEKLQVFEASKMLTRLRMAVEKREALVAQGASPDEAKRLLPHWSGQVVEGELVQPALPTGAAQLGEG